jgi:hypothetical protein
MTKNVHRVSKCFTINWTRQEGWLLALPKKHRETQRWHAACLERLS